MHSEFVTVSNSNRQLHRSRRSRRHRKSASNGTENAMKINIINDEKEKETVITPKQSSPKQAKPIKNKRIWKKSTSKKDINPMILIQAKQENDEILQKKVIYEATTNRTFLLSLTLSRIKSDPSLIICASYICRICQNLQLFVPSDVIILCHKYYQFCSFAKYIYFTSPSLCSFLKHDDTMFDLKISESLKNTTAADKYHCIARDIHLKYSNLINTIDKEEKLNECDNLNAIFQSYVDDEFPTDIYTKIILFQEYGETLCDDGQFGHTVNMMQHRDISSISLLYDIKYGLLLRIINQSEKNVFYELMNDEEKGEFIWNELMNFDAISNISLMSIFTENLFICSKDVVCLYNLENKLWNKLPSMNDLWCSQLKQLYFDGTEQKMYCMAMDGMDGAKYTFDEIQNKWMECNHCISFNVYNVIRNKWYHHSSIFSSYNESDGLMWIDENNPNIMYCTISDEYRCHVEYFDNRSIYNQWMYHHEKSSIISNIIHYHHNFCCLGGIVM